MQQFKELIELVRKCRANCPWCKKQTMDSYLKQVLSEAKELKQSVRENDIEGVKGELGDLLWNVIMLMHIAEREHLLDSDEIIRQVNDKMKRRKPYILSGREVTIKEAMKIWHEEKAREKKKGVKLSGEG